MSTVIHSLWVDSINDEMQVACIKSLNKRHEFHLYTYNGIKNPPSGAIVKDAKEIIDRRFVFSDRFNSCATFSDWFRIKLLYNLSGWRVDYYALCVRRLGTGWPFVFPTEIEHANGDHQQFGTLREKEVSLLVSLDAEGNYVIYFSLPDGMEASDDRDLSLPQRALGYCRNHYAGYEYNQKTVF